MSTATTTDTRQTTSRRTTTPTSTTPATQTERSAANRLRSTFVAVRLAFTWLGVRKTLAPEQRTTAARAFQADRELLSATKRILDTKHPSFKNVAPVRSEASGYWRAETLPFPEPGVRLLPQNKLTDFDARMTQFRQELLDAARELSSQYDAIKNEARRRLGSLFNPADYPQTLDGMFDLEVSYPPIEPPHYLIALNPGVFEAEQARVRERFESAVELAEQAFATELQKLVAHLAERLTGLQDGQPKVFRDTAITNFTEIFERFRRLNVRSNPELDALVDQARQVITGIEPQQLRDSVRLRQMVVACIGNPDPGSMKVNAPLGRRLSMTPRRRRRYSPEQVIAKLRDADAMLNSGKWPWPALEDQLRRELTDLDVVAKEAVLVTVYRQGPITHHQLGFSLGLERHETDGLLKRHKVDEDVRRAEELAEEIACLPRLIDG